MKTVAGVVGIIAVLLLNTNCGRKGEQEGDSITITFWHSFVSATVPALNALIARYESENPRIKIKAQYVPSGDALVQKLITAVQSETAPDISWIHSNFLEALVNADAIYPMNDFIQGESGLPQEDLDDIYPALMQYASFRGTLYSMPMEATNMALIYNKKMLRAAGLDPESPPANWEELHTYATRLTLDENSDGRNEQVGFFLPVFPASGPLGGWMVWNWLPYLWQAGGDVIDEAQVEVQFNSEAGVAALSLWQKIYQDLQLRTFTSDFDVAFAAGRLAMAMDGPWNLPRFNDLLKDLDWAFAPLPAGPQGRGTIVGGEYLAIFKQCDHPDEAWKFVKWIIRPDVQAFWSMKSGYLPMRRAVNDIPEFKSYLKAHPNFAVFVEQMEYARAQRPIDYHSLEIDRNLALALEKATVGGMDPKAALDEAAAKSNALLASVER